VHGCCGAHGFRRVVDDAREVRADERLERPFVVDLAAAGE
jgi:hypothetical protein